MTFFYCLRTWLYSNLLHPVFMLLGLMICNEENNIDVSGIVCFYLFMFIFSLLISLPSLLLTNLLMKLILYLKLPPDNKFLLWLFSVPSLAILNWVGFYLAIDQYRIGKLELALTLPSVLAVGFVILITYRSFFIILNQQHEKEDLV